MSEDPLERLEAEFDDNAALQIVTEEMLPKLKEDWGDFDKVNEFLHVLAESDRYVCNVLHDNGIPEHSGQYVAFIRGLFTAIIMSEKDLRRFSDLDALFKALEADGS